MNILTLSTYPFDIPRHGGQHRLLNIARLLIEAGHNVRSAGVLGSESYPLTPNFVSYPGFAALTEFIENPFLMDDWAIGKLFASNDKYFTQLADLIDIVPDVIHVEQPWLFEFAIRYRNERLNQRVKIFYGSQNIEHELKYDILKTYLTTTVAEDGAKKVLACELNALQQADGVCCVSENDLQWSRDKTKGLVVLAQNGVRETPVALNGIKEANTITGQHKNSLYCASAHPPNISGFFDIFGGGVGCFAPDERLVVAGGAGSNISDDTRFQKTAGLQKNFISAGVVSDESLQGLLHTAHVIVLPITHGGGTNLKTAEALWTGKHVVATSSAMRGFESFINSTGVRVEDTSEGFCEAIKSAMSALPLQLDTIEKEKRRILLWEHTLLPLTEMIGNY
ncbi:hypothetical protein AAKU64_003496 [Undibacterium sp. GrIS 1.8]|uniref:glycosyltransferase n=1 Tax=Undibacterium sp. GrIS 1.8 TaxID=3143934 RepID=UPI0033914059